MFSRRESRFPVSARRASRRTARADLAPRAVAEQLESRQLLAAVVWTGEGGDNLWSNAGNWSNGAVPGLADDVVIASATSNFGVIVDGGPVRVKSLFLNERLVINRGISVSVTNDIDLGPGADLKINGLLNWASGEWEDGSTPTINPGGILNIGSTVNPGTGAVSIDTDLVNLGRLAWRGGVINLSGSLTNSNAKAFDAASPMRMTGDGTFTNHGLFRKGGLATSTTTIDVDFNNADRVYTLRGTLEIGGADANIPSNINFGTYATLTPGATVIMRSPTLHGSAKFTGVGDYQFIDYTHIFRGPTMFADVSFASDAPVYIDQRGATFFGEATVNGSFIELEGALGINGTLNLLGTSVNGNFPLGVGGTMTINNATIGSDLGVSPSGRLVASGNNAINADVSNFGTIEALNGVLTIDVDDVQRSGVVQNAGTFLVSSAARIAIQGDLDSQGTLDLGVTSAAFGRITVSGDMDLSGALRIRFSGGGFPSLANFSVLTAGGSRTGSFSTFTPLGVPAGKSASVLYGQSTVLVRLS
jgi:hypothetical protein